MARPKRAAPQRHLEGVMQAGGEVVRLPVSPDGTRVAYGNGNADAIKVVDIATFEIIAIDAIGEMAAWYDDDTLIVD